MAETPTTRHALSKQAQNDVDWHTKLNDTLDKIDVKLPFYYAGDPNGFVSGDFTGALVYDTTNKELYVCTSTGNAASAVWACVTRQRKQGTDLASATTTDIGAATSDYVHVTGATTITGLGSTLKNNRVMVRFTGALTLTHNATSLILPTGANITTAAGDIAVFQRLSSGAGNWRCVQYFSSRNQPLNTEVTVASASTCDIGAAASSVIAVSGTTGITSLGSSADTKFPLYFVRFTGALTLTHNATSLILPGAADITTAAGDSAIFKYEGSGNWRMLNYQKADGTALVAASSVVPHVSGRLTLTSATPVTTTDVTAAVTIYYTPFRGNTIPIYNGTSFVATAFTEVSNDTTASSTGKAGPAAVAASKVYDLFVWSDSGTIRLTRGPAWAADTTRGTGAGTSELQLVSGIYTNKVAITNGPGAGLGTYVGTVRSDSSSKINDTKALRHCWSAHNRLRRDMQNTTETADSWSYNTATTRQANANTANQVDLVIGLAEDVIEVNLFALAKNSAGNQYFCGIGLDRTTANDAQVYSHGGGSGMSNFICPMTANYTGVLSVGRHYLAWLEAGSGAGTQTWYGDDGATMQSGLTGWLMG